MIKKILLTLFFLFAFFKSTKPIYAYCHQYQCSDGSSILLVNRAAPGEIYRDKRARYPIDTEIFTVVPEEGNYHFTLTTLYPEGPRTRFASPDGRDTKNQKHTQADRPSTNPYCQQDLGPGYWLDSGPISANTDDISYFTNFFIFDTEVKLYMDTQAYGEVYKKTCRIESQAYKGDLIRVEGLGDPTIKKIKINLDTVYEPYDGGLSPMTYRVKLTGSGGRSFMPDNAPDCYLDKDKPFIEIEKETLGEGNHMVEVYAQPMMGTAYIGAYTGIFGVFTITATEILEPTLPPGGTYYSVLLANNFCNSQQATGTAEYNNCYNCFAVGKVYTAIGCLPSNLSGLISNFLFKLGFGLSGGIAFLLLLYGGIVIITSRGEAERVNQGKEIITSAITGLLLVIFSIFILRLITVNILQIPGFSGGEPVPTRGLPGGR